MRATARGPRCRFASGGRASGSVPGCSQGTSFDRLRAHCPGARFALAKRKSAPRRPGARCSSQASVRPLNSATFASPHESRSAPVPSPVPRLSAEAHGTGEPPPCRSQLRWQAKARVPRFDEGHIAAVLHDGVRGYAAVSPVEPLSSSARFAALVGSPEVTPRGLRHHPGWRPVRAWRSSLPGGRRAERRSVPPPCAYPARADRGSSRDTLRRWSNWFVAPREVSELALGMLRVQRASPARQRPRRAGPRAVRGYRDNRTGSTALLGRALFADRAASGRAARRPMRLSGKRSSTSASRWSCPARTCCSSCWRVDRGGRILLNSPILIVGAMVVGPEFGPIARGRAASAPPGGALARRARRGLFARAHHHPRFPDHGPDPQRVHRGGHSLSNVISSPDFFNSSSPLARAWRGCCR